MGKILIYSFEKFDRLNENPSTELGKQMVNLLHTKVQIKHSILPSTYNAWNLLLKDITSFKPELIIGLGVAPGRTRLCIENVALNFIDNAKPDNKGKILRHKKVDNRAPLALEANFDVVDLCNYLKKNNIPTKVSYFADTYICNYVYFNCLNFIEKNKLKIRSVFIHIPMSPEEVNKLDADLASFPVNLLVAFLSNYVLK